MPLSEQEQRLLDEMERNLYQNDAAFVASVGGARRASARSIALGVVVALVGVVVLIVGVVVQQPLVGVLGFVVMFGGVLLAVAPPRRLSRAGVAASARRTSTGSRPATTSSAGFMDRLGERWDRRREGDER
ncbi:DUF3040 domain-containing protein [Galbitalea sp. SE-J8]|uniref:DUF3040 domain-containing protein n=1 Tax=Galbitalea sp. SE-J8 TaxID=3054952 RepID=UPI00259CD8F6|nr:DUF3040 domain-containing protein [Galbitalea sp. SE-J8]MDM4763076.1 DUF3040 domain-containing protein [Galbitalea sp. SE-J8]